MRVLVVSQFFPPDTGGTSYMLGQLAEDLARDHDVQVVVGRPSYDHVASDYAPSGVTVTRVASTTFNRRSMLGRAVNYLSFVVFSTLAAFRCPRPDVVVALTDPPFNGVVGAFVAARHRVPFVFVCHDVYPDIALALGRLRNPVVIRAWRAGNRLVFRRASQIVVVGRDMLECLAAQGADRAKLIYVPAWAERQVHDPDAVRSVRREYGWDGRFVVMHAGNVGLAQNVGIFAELADRLRHEPDVIVVVLGDGAGKPSLERLVRELGLANVSLLAPVPKRRAQALMAAADLHVVSLAPGLLGCATPSKTYGIMAAGRPFVAAVDSGSEPALIVEEEECGAWVPAGDAGALAEAVLKMRGLSLDELGQRGRAAFERRFVRELITARSQRMLESLALGTAAAGHPSPDVPSNGATAAG
jgi:colanic acid biosynthesis glycosyl transferase WcaI